MKFTIAILTVLFGVAASSVAAMACPSHDAQAQAEQSSTTTAAKTTTGKTTGG